VGRQADYFNSEDVDDILTDNEPWEDPEELTIELPPAPSFDLQLLPVALRPMVKDIAERMQVPIDFPAVVAVATLAGVCGRRAMIQPKAKDDSWEVVPNLWGAIVAEAGMMKSPVIKAVTAPARVVEKEWRAKYEDEMLKHLRDKRRWSLDQSVQDGEYKKSRKVKLTNDPKSTPELPDPEPEPKPPVQSRLLTTDATLESLHKLLEQNAAGIFVLRDELTGWLTSLEKVGRESERSFYLECWNGDSSFTLDRIGRGSIYVDNCCVSLFGGIQPSRLRSYFADAMTDGQSGDGLIQRFQLLIWPDKPNKWVYEDRKKDTHAFEKAEEVYRGIASLNSQNPLRLKFSEEAQSVFQDWLTQLMDIELRDEELHTSLESHFSKYRSLMPSLAMLFSLADGNRETVGVEHTRQAVAWCTYLKEHAKRVYASRTDPAKSAAIVLKKKLEKGLLGDAKGTFTFRELCRKEWAELSRPDQARAALGLLEEDNWVRKESRKSDAVRADLVNGGRPSEKYRINPKVLGRLQHSGAARGTREGQDLKSEAIAN
jgi:hypothetical protein